MIMTEALLAIRKFKVKISYNKQSMKDFEASFDEIFNEIVVLAQMLSMHQSKQISCIYLNQ